MHGLAAAWLVWGSVGGTLTFTPEYRCSQGLQTFHLTYSIQLQTYGFRSPALAYIIRF